MGRLKATPSRLQQAGSRLSQATAVQRQRTRGSTWMATRERILMRDRGLCQCDECKATKRLRMASEVDHRVPLFEGGTDDESNLQAINAECHKVKSAAEAKRRGGGC